MEPAPRRNRLHRADVRRLHEATYAGIANDAVELHAKLPGWFKAPTPLGSYNPDWAVLIDTVEGEGLYFVVETKGSTGVFDLCPAETAKIKCGEAHFEALAVREDHARHDR